MRARKVDEGRGLPPLPASGERGMLGVSQRLGLASSELFEF